MTTYKLNNISVYATPESLYITNGDQHLVSISGEEKELLELVIEAFQETDQKDTVFQRLQSELFNDKSYFDLLLNYLIENRILIAKTKTDKLEKNVLVIGNFDETSVVANQLKQEFDRDRITYTIDVMNDPGKLNLADKHALDGIDLVILFAPIVLNYNVHGKVGNYCYEKNIPILHAETQGLYYVLGPLLDPQLNSASLNCYFKRKMSGLDNPDDYLRVIQIPNKKEVHIADIKKEIFFDTLIGLIGIELERYFVHGIRALVGREVTFDGVSHETNVTKILKIQTPITVIRPFND